jgi:DNA polymerase III gamma/tau subunit
LIPDELYADLLDLVAGRRAAEVLPFVSRLVEAGADLSEFAGGLGEVLRALLQQVLGSEPEGLSPAVREAVARHAPQYRPADVLRMLRLLADAEESIRRSPHARLHVETLLLQLAVLDRTVELNDVLDALRARGAAGAPGSRPERPERPGPAREAGTRGSAAAPAEAKPASAAVQRAPAPPAGGGVAGGAPPVPGVLGRWPEIVEAVAGKKRVLKEALSEASVSMESGAVVLVASSEVHLEGLANGKALIREVIEAVTGQAVEVVVRAAGRPEAAGGEEGPRRLNADRERQERLSRYRAKDPGLDAAVEALDLELLD